MSWQANLPRGCSGIPYRPVRTTGDVWSNALSGGSHDIWLYYKVQPKPSGVTGKKFSMDLVIKGSSPNYFVYNVTRVDVAFQFYSIVTQKWTDFYHWGGWRLSDYTESATTAGRKLWNNYRTYGRYRPAWGIHRSSMIFNDVEITAAGPSYDEYKAIAESKGVVEQPWDKGIGGQSYSAAMPWGVRYLSNGVNAQPGSHYPDPNPFIKKHGQQGWASTFSGLDKGGTASGFKTVDLSADWIRQRVGTLAGITAFKMRVRLGWERNGDIERVWDTWYFGGNNPNGRDQDRFTTIDNPLIGLLDYGPRGSKEATWPPRFDAQAYYRNKGGSLLKLQARYKPKNGSWNIF